MLRSSRPRTAGYPGSCCSSYQRALAQAQTAANPGLHRSPPKTPRTKHPVAGITVQEHPPHEPHKQHTQRVVSRQENPSVDDEEMHIYDRIILSYE